MHSGLLGFRFRTRVEPLLVLLVLLVMVVAIVGVLAVAAHAAPVAAADTCANPDCHSWGPGPGPNATSATPVAAASTTPTPIPMARPASMRAQKASRPVVIKGGLVAHSEATTVTLEISRKVGERYRVWKKVDVSVASGSSTYAASVRVARKGTWRVRALHSDAEHALSASAYRVFAVK